MDLAPVTTWAQWEILNFEIHLKKKNNCIFLGVLITQQLFFYRPQILHFPKYMQIEHL